MKLLLSILLLGLTLQASATTVTGQDLKKYKKAVLDVDPFKDNCIFYGKTNGFLRHKMIITDATSLEIIDGVQSLLVFTYQRTGQEIESNNFKNEVIISIDSSHKAILSIEARGYKMIEVNHGDLENPILSKELVLYGTAKCNNFAEPNLENNL